MTSGRQATLPSSGPSQRHNPSGGLLADLLRRRVILVTGKGGVGRTSVAAALAGAAAQTGRRVLLGEIAGPEGGGSPLAQLFGRERFNPTPCEIAENLRACSLWAPTGHELFLRSVLPGGGLISLALRSKAIRTFMAAAPSLIEMGWFYHLLALLRAERPDETPQHELIVLDMPATGHALALTSLPAILHRMIERGPLVKALSDGQSYLNDPEKTAAWVVTLPEILPVSEAIELIAGLEKTAVPLGGVVLNRFPTDLFTPKEREYLGDVLTQQPLLGDLEFHRMARGREAEARLRERVDLPVLRIPELECDRDDFLSAITSGLRLGEVYS